MGETDDIMQAERIARQVASNLEQPKRPILSNVLTLLGMLGALLLIWAQASMSAGELRTRVSVVEQRQAEDRADLKDQVKEIKADVKQMGSDMQRVLIILGDKDSRSGNQRERR